MTDNPTSLESEPGEVTFEVLLFDVGGVLVEFKGSRRLIELAGGEITRERIAEFRRVTSPLVKKLESGECSIEEFARSHLQQWPSGLSEQGLVEELESWPLKLYPGALELLDALRSNYLLACLSNTNPIHWPLQRDRLGLGSYFVKQFVSYELRALKPDPVAYQKVIDQLGCPPDRVLFLDDRQENVDAAIDAGLAGRCVKGITETRQALTDLQLL